MNETTIDLRELFRTIRKHFRVILNICLGFVVVALLISFLIPPTYQAETSLRVKQSKGLGSSLFSELPIDSSFGTKQLMATYAEMIKSRTVVQEVIDKTQSGKPEAPKYEGFVMRITTQPVKDTEILKIRVEGDTPLEAQTVANTLVEAFTARLTYLVRAEQSAVREFIGERVKESRSELDKAQAALEKYQREQKILTPTEEVKAVVERISLVKKIAAESAVRLASAQARLAAAQKQLDNEKPGFVADSPLLQQYKSKLAELEVQLVSLQSRDYGARHPQVAAIQASITDIKAKITTEVEHIVSANAPSMNPIHQGIVQSRIQAEAEIAAGSAQQIAIGQIMLQNEQELKQLPAKEQGVSRLTRDALVAQEIYIMLAKRYEEARISEVMQPTDLQVVDVAVAPEKPISPKKALNAILAAILGLFFGLGVVFYQEYSTRMINNAQDAKQCLGLPILGSIPDFDSYNDTAPPGLWGRIKRKK